MALHFTHEEFRARQDRALAAMAEAGLDALLMFNLEISVHRCPPLPKSVPLTV